MKNIFLILLLCVFGCKQEEISENNSIIVIQGNGVIDVDDKYYPTVIIGNQEWMQKNLAVAKYKNGNPINYVTNNTDWANTNDGAFCMFENVLDHDSVYGKLYNWFAVHDTSGLCPQGWHVPTDNDWAILESNLGGAQIAGGELKSIYGWEQPNIGATNFSAFTALPGGYREGNGFFHNNGLSGGWWTSSVSDSFTSFGRSLNHSNSNVGRGNFHRVLGFSVRCIRD
jgi:uncharacterized protein (TIGR02145 family)